MLIGFGIAQNPTKGVVAKNSGSVCSPPVTRQLDQQEYDEEYHNDKRRSWRVAALVEDVVTRRCQTYHDERQPGNQ